MYRYSLRIVHNYNRWVEVMAEDPADAINKVWAMINYGYVESSPTENFDVDVLLEGEIK